MINTKRLMINYSKQQVFSVVPLLLSEDESEESDFEEITDDQEMSM